MILFLFGDSITQGYWDSKGGWADRIRSYVLEQDVNNNFNHYHGVYNLGIDGNTTQQVLDRFENEVKARLWKDAEYAFIFAVGTNDTVIQRGGRMLTDPSRYANQIKQLHSKASKYSSKIAFINLLPVDEALTNPLPNSTSGKCYTNERIESFNSTLEAQCNSLNVTVIDARSSFIESDNLLADGLHPNDEGHKAIYEKSSQIVINWLYAN